jgi:hypothetical protein
MESKIEKYILTRSMHLGNIKDTFGRGALIMYNSATQKVKIDGRIFDNGYKDVEILKRQAMKKPHDPWIIQYSDEAMAEIRGDRMEAEPAIPKRLPNNHGMQVVQSDEDSQPVIDISHTQVSKIKQREQEAARQKKATGDMPVVQGYQSVEDRIQELENKKNTDLSARAEKVRLMQSRKADLPIVRDDRLGSMGGSSAEAMNAGSIVGGRRPEQAPEYVDQATAARKQEVENNRNRAAQEMGVDPFEAGIDEMTHVPVDEFEEGLADEFEEGLPAAAPVPSTDDIELEADEPTQDEKDAEIAALKAKLAAMEADKAEKAAEEPGDTAPPKAKKMPVT